MNDLNRIEKIVINDGTIKVELHEDGLYRMYTSTIMSKGIGLQYVGYGKYTLGDIVSRINQFKERGAELSFEVEMWLEKNK